MYITHYLEHILGIQKDSVQNLSFIRMVERLRTSIVHVDLGHDSMWEVLLQVRGANVGVNVHHSIGAVHLSPDALL